LKKKNLGKKKKRPPEPETPFPPKGPGPPNFPQFPRPQKEKKKPFGGPKTFRKQPPVAKKFFKNLSPPPREPLKPAPFPQEKN